MIVMNGYGSWGRRSVYAVRIRSRTSYGGDPEVEICVLSFKTKIKIFIPGYEKALALA